MKSPSSVQPGRAPAAQRPTPPARNTADIATELYRSMKGGVWGVGTREAVIFSALSGLSREQLDEVRDHYQNHYGRSLDEDLRKELGGMNEWRAEQLLKGRNNVADAEGLRAALSLRKDEDAAVEILERNWTQGTLPALEQKVPVVCGAKLRALVDKKLSKPNAAYARALLDGSPQEIARASVARAIAPKKLDVHQQEKLVRLLESLGEGRRFLDEDLRYAVLEKVGDIDLHDAAHAAMTGNDLGRRVALLHRAVHLSPAKAAPLLAAALVGTNALEREKIRESYNNEHAMPLHQDLREAKHAGTVSLASQLLRTGSLDALTMVDVGLRAKLPAMVVEGIHTAGEAGLPTLLEDYRNKTGHDLDHDLKGRLDGLAQFQVEWAFAHPGAREESAEYVEALHAFARDGLRNLPSRVAMDSVIHSRQGKQFDRTVRMLSDRWAQEKAPVDTLVHYALDDFETFSDAREKVAKTVAAAVAGLASTATVATFGAGAPMAVAALAAAGTSTAARVVGHAAMAGTTFTKDDLRNDVLMGVALGAATAAARPIADLVVTQIKQVELNALFDWLHVPPGDRTALANEIAQDYLQDDIYQFGPAHRIGMRALDGAVHGALGGGASYSASTAVRRETWEEDFSTGLESVAKSFSQGAGMGLIFGAVGSVAADYLGMAAKMGPISDDDPVLSHPVQVKIGDELKTVYVTGQLNDEAVEGIRKALQNMADKSNGVALRDLESIYAFPQGNFGGLYRMQGHSFVVSDQIMNNNPDFANYVVPHEMGHMIDPAGGARSHPLFALFRSGDSSNPFGKPPYLDDYASQNAAEDYAQTHAFLFSHWDQIKENPDLLANYTDHPTQFATKIGYLLGSLYPGEDPALQQAVSTFISDAASK